MLTLITLSIVMAADYQPQDGDIIFHTSLSSQSQAIQLATQSPYSHVGVVYLKKNKPYVYEAIRTVQLTPLKKWIARGKSKHYRVLRPRVPLNSEQIRLLYKEGENYKGLSYDLKFEWSDEKIYCSELVWKMYRGIGIQLSTPKAMKDYHFDHPKVQKKLQQRWGNNIHWNEPMVAPSDLVQSLALKVVYDSRKSPK